MIWFVQCNCTFSSKKKRIRICIVCCTVLKLRKFTTTYSHNLVRKNSVKSIHLALYYYFMWFHEIFLGESKFLVFSHRCRWILLNFRDSCNFAFLLEISDAAKDKFIHQMAYRCPPPELPDLEEVLKRRRNKQVNIHITPRTRQAERKTKILISNVFLIYFIKNMDRAYVLE